MRETSKSAAPASDITAEPYGRSAHSFGLMGATPFDVDADGTLDWGFAPDAARLLRCRPETLPHSQEGLNARLDMASRRRRNTALRSLTWDGARYRVSYQIDGLDGRRVWVEERGQRLSGQGQTASDITAIIIDIESRKLEEAKAIYHASYDPLTDLWNERRLREAVSTMHRGLQYFGRNGALVRLKLSNIPDINDSYGYDTGDHLITALAQRLSVKFPAPDLLGRIGGISFGVALADCEADEMTSRVNKLLSYLSDTPYPSPHGNLYAEVNASCVPMSAKGGVDIEALFSASRAALAVTQDMGARYVPYDADKFRNHNVKPKTQAEDVIAALNDRRVSLAYQPIVDAKSRDLHHYECLLRLKRGDGEIVSAGGFIMAAEKLGLVHLLDRRALEIASETLLRYSDIRLALNVSAATVKYLETADAYLDALRALGPATKRVTLELTETVALEDPAMASRFSVEARMLGCEFSIDDFGSGYTTFQNLMAIEADSVKIDGSFIQDLSMTPHKQTFVRMMVDLAQTFGVKTVAEMVETREDADLLKRLGVDYLQGYLFGVPSAAPAWQRHTGA
ncbi:EAL domain-containing protein [Fretibacter rubidus]|uniref:EAL domain-containing protein n=1 Tax=Fretibacter rubidus TaxID=570162 RepID=UPI00352B1858